MHASSSSAPGEVGVGLRAPHVRHVLDTLPAVPFLEVHSENYFGAGAHLEQLESVRRHYPVSLHGVGASLGSVDQPDAGHLDALEALVRRIEPRWVSEHLCWGAAGGRHLNDLLPLPYTEEALDVVVRHVTALQERLRRRVLVENVSSYVRFSHSTLSEWAFLAELVRRTGCGLLLDVNNVHVNSVNHGFDPLDFLDGIPAGAVQEMHLAGFSRRQGLGGPLLIDSHDRRVDAAVWSLYDAALACFGAVPTLIEWDADLPAFEVLQDEARQAREHMHAAATLPV